MFRPSTPEDITDFEFKPYVEPHFNLVESYLKNYLIPDYCEFLIFSAYRNHLEEDSYDIFISSALGFFNVDSDKKDRITWKKKITGILDIKYDLKIMDENPLRFKEGR